MRARKGYGCGGRACGGNVIVYGSGVSSFATSGGRRAVLYAVAVVASLLWPFAGI